MPASPTRIYRLRYSLPAALLIFGYNASLFGQAAPTPTASGDDGSGQAVVLSPFEIQAQANKGYQAANVEAASKLALPIKDVPQTVTVLTQEFLQDISAASLAEAMVYVPGVTPILSTRNQDGFVIRGFPEPLTYLDGFRDGESWASGETVQIEQLEILKGPSTNLYGNSIGFGGIINRVSKQPQAVESNTAELTVGNYDFFRLTYDSTGPLSADKSWLYRITAADTSSDTFRDGIKLKRYYVSPVITKKFGTDTTLTLNTEFLRNDTQEDIGLPAVTDPSRTDHPVVIPNIPISRNYAEPWEDSLLQKEAVRLLGTHNFGEHWSLRTAATVAYYNNPIYQVEALSVSNNETLNRDAFDLNRWEDNYDLEADLLGHFKTGPFEHHLLLGYQYYHDRGRSNVKRAPLASIDIYNPVYTGAPKPNFVGLDVTNLLYTDSFYGYYANEQISTWDDRIELSGGIRRDRVGYWGSVQLPGGATVDYQPIYSTTPQYGIVLKPLPNISVYGEFSKAFVPITGSTTPTFATLPPELGQSKEAGVKTSFFDGRLGVDVAVFQINESNEAVRLDPPLQSFFASGGSITGKGEEVNLSYNDEHWNFIGGLTREALDNVTPPSTIIHNIYQNSWQFFGKYTFHDGIFNRLALGAGTIHQPGTNFDNNQGYLNGYYRVDVHASYALNRAVSFSLSVLNVFNKKYYLGAGSPGFIVIPGAPITVRLSARYSF